MSNENPNEPPNIPPPNQGWSVPPQHTEGPQQGAPPPGYYQQPQNSTLDKIIPTKNPAALTAYYLGVFSVVCGILAPFALGLGIKGLSDIKKKPELPGKGHAITGIVLGGIFTAIWAFLFVIIIMAILKARTV